MAPAGEIPGWFVAYEESEAAAAVVIESLCDQISDIRAHSKAGLAIKLSILASLYREDPTALRDEYESDAASRLLQSVLDDVSNDSDQPNLPF